MGATLPTAIFIVGPTCSGKSAIAMQLAKHFNTVILSADSRQCYQGMEIGTAQPTAQDLATVNHYFIGHHPVTTILSAADYEVIALNALTEIFKYSPIAIVCGGTGLYINALCYGLDKMPAIDTQIDLQVNHNYKLYGVQWLQTQLLQHDPATYRAIDHHNPARLIRALVFFLSTGESILKYRTHAPVERPFSALKFGIDVEREQLYLHINQRVDSMIACGLLEEAKKLYPYKHLKNLNTVGYSELFAHFEGHYSLSEAIDKIKQHTRNYAKRQMTWFSKDKSIIWCKTIAEIYACLAEKGL